MLTTLHKGAIRWGFRLAYSRSSLLRRARELEASQWLSREEILALQWQRLKELVQHAYQNVPYYRTAMDKLGLAPLDIQTPQDYARLPILTKQEINAHREEMVAQNYPKEKLIPTASGGSTGAPVHLYHDPGLVAAYRAAKLRNFRWVGWAPGDAWARLWGSAFDVAPHQALLGRMWDRLTRVLILPCFQMDEDTMEEYARALLRFKPDVIEAYTTPMYLFARFLESKGIKDIQPKGVICSAEMLFPYQREAIEKVFHCKVFNRYGGREMGDVSHECPEGSLHINAENIYVEFLRDGQPGRPGEAGEIILTPLDSYGMPLLRYQVEDIGSPSEKDCSCGRGLPLMEVVEGRVQDLISLPSGRYLPGEFFPHLFKDFDIVRFQVVQESLRHLLIKIVKGNNLPQRDIDYLVGKIREYVGDAVELELDFVDDIPLTPSGKFRYTVSKVPMDLVSLRGETL